MKKKLKTKMDKNKNDESIDSIEKNEIDNENKLE